MSSFTLSNYFFGCLHCCLLSLTERCRPNIFTGNRSLHILETCSNQVNLRSAILTTKVSQQLYFMRFNRPHVVRPPGTAVPARNSRSGRAYILPVMFFFFRQPYLRGPSTDRRETLPHDRNLAAIAGQGRTTWGSSPKKF